MEAELAESTCGRIVVPDETIHESPVGKGLAGVLKLLKDRGTLEENIAKKKNELDDGKKEIRIERTDEHGRILTPKEAFRLLSHKFHGKGPGKRKQEKRIRQYQEELKVKKMKSADTPSLSAERMRDTQAKLQTPYLVLSEHVKPWRSSDRRSGFATVEKDCAGGLTRDKKNYHHDPFMKRDGGGMKNSYMNQVENLLNIKRKSESGDSFSQKKPKT